MGDTVDINSYFDLNILLIDDDGDDCSFFGEALKQIDGSLQFTCGQNSEKVYHYIEETKPHLIFMDINMPGKNGIQWLRELKAHEQYKDIPIIIYSVSMNESDKQACMEAGAHHYLVKPYVESNLHTTLKKIFSRNWKVAQSLPPKERFVIDIDYT